jgi:hypothetical protein
LNQPTRLDETDNRCVTRDNHASFPALTALRLSVGEWHALRNQGSVRRERRGNRIYFKLAFRLAGKQRIKYIPARQATIVAAELRQLQRHRELKRQLRSCDEEARRDLRMLRQVLAPLLASGEFYLHGTILRKARARNKPKSTV